MNAYEKSQQLGLTGTDAEVFAQLQTMGMTHSPINRAELMFNLNLLKMLQRVVGNNVEEKWRGSVLTMQDAINSVGTQDQKDAMVLWLSHITNTTNLQWDTTNPLYSAGFWGMYTAFKDQPGMPTTANFTAIAALGGGWIATTVGDFTAQRLAAQAAEAARVEAEANAVLATTKQAALAEANDTAITLITDTPSASKTSLIAAFTTRLNETWPA